MCEGAPLSAVSSELGLIIGGFLVNSVTCPLAFVPVCSRLFPVRGVDFAASF